MGMKYKKGMKRYHKAEGKYKEGDDGDYYMGDDKKMYKMAAPTLAGTVKEPASYKKGEVTVTVDDFQKSLDQLGEITRAGDPESRKDELLAKAQNGEDLTKEEQEELYKAIGGGDGAVDDDPEIVKAVTDLMDPDGDGNEDLKKALDVSEFLESQHNALTATLEEVAKSIDASDQRQHSFNMVFAKAFHQVGELVKGMSERLGIIEKQPVGGPRSKGIPQQPVPAAGQVVEKGFSGAPPGDEQMSKGEILDVMESMMTKSVDGGKDGLAPCGEDIVKATAQYEGGNEISKGMLADVIEFRRENAH